MSLTVNKNLAIVLSQSNTVMRDGDEIGGFQRRLRARREEMKLTQVEVARLTGIKQYRGYETSDKYPTVTVLKKIARALKTTVSYLIGEEARGGVLTHYDRVPEFRALVDGLVALSARDRREFLNLLQAFADAVGVEAARRPSVEGPGLMPGEINRTR